MKEIIERKRPLGKKPKRPVAELAGEKAYLVKFEYDAISHVYRGSVTYHGPDAGRVLTPTIKYLLVYAISFGAAQEKIENMFFDARNFENLTVF